MLATSLCMPAVPGGFDAATGQNLPIPFPSTTVRRFRVQSRKLPVPLKKFPVPARREFRTNALRTLPHWTSKWQPRAAFRQNSLLISLLAGNYDAETGSRPTASSGTQSVSRATYERAPRRRPENSCVDATQRNRRPKTPAHSFAWIKTVGGLRKTRHRGRSLVEWFFVLTATAYNRVRIPKLLAATG
jgi:hypothetical protein